MNVEAIKEHIRFLDQTYANCYHRGEKLNAKACKSASEKLSHFLKVGFVALAKEPNFTMEKVIAWHFGNPNIKSFDVHIEEKGNVYLVSAKPF